jgi:hypothetical protein
MEREKNFRKKILSVLIEHESLTYPSFIDSLGKMNQEHALDHMVGDMPLMAQLILEGNITASRGDIDGYNSTHFADLWKRNERELFSFALTPEGKNEYLRLCDELYVVRIS